MVSSITVSFQLTPKPRLPRHARDNTPRSVVHTSGDGRVPSGRSRISFAIHGNNHTREELRRVDELDRASTLAAQALQRVSAIRSAGVDIAPVMVPPHGVCSLATLEGCLRAGFDALCADWPYWWLTERESVTTLSGWWPLDRLRGLPPIPRLTWLPAIWTTSFALSAAPDPLRSSHGSERASTFLQLARIMSVLLASTRGSPSDGSPITWFPPTGVVTA